MRYHASIADPSEFAHFRMKSILRRKTFIAGALVTGIAGYSFLGYSRIQAKPLSFELPLRSREEQLRLLKSQQFDVLVIGGMFITFTTHVVSVSMLSAL
jgi:hypothetical protein